MPVATTRNFLSDVLWSVDDDTYTVSTAVVPVKSSSSFTASPFGIALIWDNSLGAMRPVLNADNTLPTPSTVSSLPDNSVVCVSVGNNQGLGNDNGDVTLTTVAQYMTVVFRDSAIIFDNLVYGDAADATTKDLIKLQLEKQEVVCKTKSPSIVQSFVS